MLSKCSFRINQTHSQVIEILSDREYLLPYPRIYHNHPFNHWLELFASETVSAGYPRKVLMKNKWRCVVLLTVT